MHLNTAIEQYLIFNYHLSARTKKIYTEHLARLSAALGNVRLADIDDFCLAQFMAGLRARNGDAYSAGYKSQIYRALNTFFNFCVARAWLTSNPLSTVKKPKVVNGPKPRLSLAQVEQLLRAVADTEAAERNLAMVLLMVDCGLRVSEVVNLTLGDVFLDEMRLSVFSAKTVARRDVPLSEMAGLSLKTYLDTKRNPGDRSTAAVFLRVKGIHKGEPVTTKALEELMKRLKRRLKFPVYCHLLRHTFGNHYIRIGGLRYLQKILGHSRIDTTARYYTDPDFPDLQREHARAAPTAQLGK